MTQDSQPEKQETLAQQKKRLLQECDAYRAGIGRSRRVVSAHLGPNEIAKTAIGLVSRRAQIAFANFSDMFDFNSLTAAKLQRLLPLVVSGVSLLAKGTILRSLLRGAAVAGVGATAIYFATRKKKKASQEHVALHERL
ncbi:MAG: hypothetical protein Q7T66_05770 [Herminiimonas sp.]|jgi:hypothetical protein|uniref:hypothetical protein n=1 Tax=Herminiimonas sp. TaxID=1926289 RepID=UPI002726D2AE|nr:hypothetical protein [Herminiimonas sp.]MDO9420153.1 hypothetical protein [Herminiimonas sp.]